MKEFVNSDSPKPTQPVPIPSVPPGPKPNEPRPQNVPERKSPETIPLAKPVPQRPTKPEKK